MFLEFEDMGMDLEIGKEVVIEEYVVMDETMQHEAEETEGTSKCAETTSVSDSSKFATIVPGTTVVFREEGSLFPGKVMSSLHPYYVVAAMAKCIGGGWKWPDKKRSPKLSLMT